MVALMLLSLFDYNFDIPCFFKKYLGIECPWCGTQRALHLLLQGNVVDSFLMFPALIPLIVLFIFLVAHLFFKFRNGSRILLSLFIICVVLIVVNYLLKMS